MRNTPIAERFGTCGDYRHGVARIRCTNPECGHERLLQRLQQSISSEEYQIVRHLMRGLEQ